MGSARQTGSSKSSRVGELDAVIGLVEGVASLDAPTSRVGLAGPELFLSEVVEGGELEPLMDTSSGPSEGGALGALQLLFESARVGLGGLFL